MEQQEFKSVQEKRKYRTKRRKKKRIKFFSILITLVVVFGTMTVLSLTVFFPIKTIKVTGNNIYSADEVKNTSGVITGDNLILANSKRANEAICATLPYVESVSFKRAFPFTLEIKIKESKVFAQIKVGKRYVNINSEGKCLEKDVKYIKGATVVTGTALSTAEIAQPVVFERDSNLLDTLAEIKQLLITFKENNLDGITVINLKNEQDIKITYKDKIVLLFGANSDMEQKISHAIETIKQREDNDETGTLNLSRIPGKKNEASFIPKDLDADEVASSKK